MSTSCLVLPSFLRPNVYITELLHVRYSPSRETNLEVIDLFRIITLAGVYILQ